jgi:Flp pilus assembly protein TadG
MMLRQRIARFDGFGSRHGVTALMDVILTFPVMMVMIFTVLYFGRAWYVRAMVEDVAAAGTRWAATSLSGAQGCTQALQAMQTVIAGYYLDPSAATLSVQPEGAWGRNGKARVSVSFTLNQSAIPIVGAWWGNPKIERQLVVPIDRNVNRYSNGWRACGDAPPVRPSETWPEP